MSPLSAETTDYIVFMAPFVARQALWSNDNIYGIAIDPIICNPSMVALYNVGTNKGCCKFGQVLDGTANCATAPTCPPKFTLNGRGTIYHSYSNIKELVVVKINT